MMYSEDAFKEKLFLKSPLWGPLSLQYGTHWRNYKGYTHGAKACPSRLPWQGQQIICKSNMRHLGSRLCGEEGPMSFFES